MIPPELTPAVFLALKLLALLGIAIYVVFAGVMVRQERLMADVLEEGFEPFLRLLTIIHLAAAVATFLLALFIL